MKRKDSNRLPKTAGEISNGGVFRQAVKCGKRSCRCSNGDLHQDYYYYIRRVDGRLRKTYVPKQQVTHLTALVSDARAARAKQYAIRQRSHKLFTAFSRSLQEYEAAES